MAKGRKRRRVPEVLWRLFHNKARTLADTVLSLLPSPPPAVGNCRCKGRRCLGCSGDKARSFLLRHKDPADYRKLLDQCFVVIPYQAPPFSGFDPHNRWSQLETVRRNIEMIICEQPASSNVLCSGYDKSSRLSSIVEHLISSAWCLLLKRVGDNLMAYLLRNTLIFLPLPHRKHHQVSGFPISDLCKAFSKDSINFKHYPSKFHHGSGKKRKRVDGKDLVTEDLQITSTFNTDFSSCPPSCVGCSIRYEFTPPGSCCRQKFSQNNIIHGTAIAAGAKHFSTDVSSLEDLQESSTRPLISKKRVRKYSWQRNRKRRHLSSQELIHCTSCLNDKDNSYIGPQCGFNSYRGLHSQETRCPCCLIFQTLPKIIRKAQIDRQSIFYKLKNYPSIFPKKHILNSLKPNYSGANALFRDIFGSSDVHFTARLVHCLHSTKYCFIKSTCLYHSIIKQLKILIRKVRGCQLLKLLDKHCGMIEESESVGNMHKQNEILHASDVPSEIIGTDSKSCMRIPKAYDYKLQPSNVYCLKKQVISFIWAVCRSIVPQDLLGSPYNWRILRKNISMFVRLRRFEKFSLKQCTHNLKISKFPLLSNKHSLCYVSNSEPRHGKRGSSTCMMQSFNRLNAADAVRHKVLQCWILWFFSCLVVPLMQTNFYITESENGKQDVCYYRISVWQKLMDQALGSLKDRSYGELTYASVHRIVRNRSFGFSRIRFRPRDRGFRVLANLRAPSRIPVKSCSIRPSSSSSKMSLNTRNVKYNYFKSVNNVLQGVHAVLKGIQLKEPEKLGSSVFDYTDVYRKFVPFLNLLKRESSSVPGVCIIVSDVSKAFDSINQNKLLSVMEDVISHDEYPLNMSLQVGCTRKCFMVRQQLMLPHQEHISWCSAAATSVPISTLHGVLVKEEPRTTMRKVEIFSYLNEHIKHNVLQLDTKFYLQRVGISQGCVLSSLLCSFYYGHLEKNVIFPFLEKASELASGDSVDKQTPDQTSASKIHPKNETVMGNCNYLLLRFIDDYLYISTSKKQASLFFSRMQRGFRGYNCYMNERKFGFNFDMDGLSGFESNRLYVGGDGMSFLRWSGLLVNCCTLEIQADYTRYLNCHLSSSLTISWNDHPARLLKSKLSDYLRPKCHPIFYDTNINSAAVIRLNIYQAFLLCAMKFNCYIRNFSSISAFSTECCMDAIETSLRYMHKLMKRRMRALQTNTGFRPIFNVGKDETKWLGVTAFIRALSRKQSRYRELLLMLRSKLEAQGETGTSSALKYAIDDAHSSVLWKIKY